MTAFALDLSLQYFLGLEGKANASASFVVESTLQNLIEMLARGEVVGLPISGTFSF